VSPGSFAFYDYISLVPLAQWRPISVSPADSLRGLLFLAAMSLLYATAFREFAESRWRRRVVGTIVATAFFMTLEALFQAASSDPERIYGIWKPTWSWGVFGPYVNKNHFAGFVVMAIPLAMASSASAFRDLRRDWRRRRIGWLALGDAAGNAFVRRVAVTLTLIIGVLVSRSRGGAMAFVLSMLAAPLLVKRRLWAVAALGLLAVGAMEMLGTDGLTRHATRGLQDSRIVVWRDALRMLPDFPVLGSGMNTFGSAYPRYQRVWKSVWFGEAHNEYLQALFDMGALGLVLVAGLLFRLLAAGARNASGSVIGMGVLGGLLASAAHNLVDFNWQIPANAATFATLAGLAMQALPPTGLLDPPEGHA
jgi:O-antigen ligase